MITEVCIQHREKSYVSLGYPVWKHSRKPELEFHANFPTWKYDLSFRVSKQWNSEVSYEGKFMETAGFLNQKLENTRFPFMFPNNGILKYPMKESSWKHQVF